MSGSRRDQDLRAKLDVFDKNSREAACYVVSWLAEHSDDLIAVARGRHVMGHYRFQERGLFEYDVDGLLAEAAEELADAIVYIARRIAILHEVDGSADTE